MNRALMLQSHHRHCQRCGRVMIRSTILPGSACLPCVEAGFARAEASLRRFETAVELAGHAVRMMDAAAERYGLGERA